MLRTTLTWMALLAGTVLYQPAGFAEGTLDEALNRAASELDTTTAFRLDGRLTKDSDPKRLRLYPNPKNRALYYLIRRKDIVEEPYKWTDSEKAAAGFAGPEARYRVAVEHGAIVHVVTMTVLNHRELQQQQQQLESRMLQAISNVMKKASDQESDVIENLK